jgi:hypothetical protein
VDAKASAYWTTSRLSCCLDDDDDDDDDDDNDDDDDDDDDSDSDADADDYDDDDDDDVDNAASVTAAVAAAADDDDATISMLLEVKTDFTIMATLIIMLMTTMVTYGFVNAFTENCPDKDNADGCAHICLYGIDVDEELSPL